MWKIAAYLVVFSTFALRVFQLGQQSLWYDEGFSLYLSSQDIATITSTTAADIHPPLYYYVLHYWLIAVGSSEFAVRYLSLLWGVLSVPVLCILTGKIFSFSRSTWYPSNLEAGTDHLIEGGSGFPGLPRHDLGRAVGRN